MPLGKGFLTFGKRIKENLEGFIVLGVTEWAEGYIEYADPEVIVGKSKQNNLYTTPKNLYACIQTYIYLHTHTYEKQDFY